MCVFVGQGPVGHSSFWGKPSSPEEQILQAGHFDTLISVTGVAPQQSVWSSRGGSDAA